MKHFNNKTFVTIILLLMTMMGTGTAQNYESVIKSDFTSWTLYHGELEYYMKDLAYVQHIDDTYCLYFWAGYEYLTYIDFVGTIREENGRLWITYAEYPNDEILYMDMNLEVGDEFVFNNYYTGVVTEILYINKRKIIVFDRPSLNWFREPIMFIEGIGRNIMSFGWYDNWDFGYQCCKHDGSELAYSTSNPHFENCELLTASVGDFSNHNTLEIYPNPTKDSFTVSLNDSQEPYVINIFNCNGVLVKTVQTYCDKTTIGTEQFEAGLYLLEIVYQQQILHKKLLIINY